MATVSFTSFIQRHFHCPSLEVFGYSVREVLEAYFEENRRARDYILDERGCLRPRLSLIVDGILLSDRVNLSDPVHAHASVHVFQTPLDTEYEGL